MASLQDFLLRARRLYFRSKFEWLAGYPRYQDSLDQAREAKSGGDWSGAETHFRAASIVRPDSIGPRINLGQALMEQGRIDEAEQALVEAIRRAPRSAEAYLKLGHCLSLAGRRDEAAAAYATAAALRPPTVRADISSVWSMMRDTLMPPPPSDSNPVTDAVVVMEGRGASPSVLRGMLDGLSRQSDRRWSAVVLVDEGVADHPVASFALQDRRLRLAQSAPEAVSILETHPPVVEMLLVSPNTCLETSAFNWLRATSRLVNADAVYGDHDHHHQDVRRSPRWFGPVLAGAPAALDLSTTPSAPAVLHMADADWRALLFADPEQPRLPTSADLLKRLIEAGGAPRHLPVLLSSVRVVAGQELPPRQTKARGIAAHALPQRITVIIPTRDEAGVLEACVKSLLATANRPEALEIIVLDNRSRLDKTFETLTRLKGRAGFSTRPVDEPFNWSRLNNLGAADATGDILVFANNDIEMRSIGWDTALKQRLSDPAVGAVGARLLYPDGTLQHVGVVLGAVAGRPVHEGRAAAATDGGPQDRWRRTREVGAVTGAFLAVRSDTFAAAGGFDEGLAVAYNDLDFCLRIRALGLTVVYSPEIEATHHESKTRGVALTAEKIAWDDEEFEQLHRTWGTACTSDPYVHPAWKFTTETSFEGIQAVSQEQRREALEGDMLRSSGLAVSSSKNDSSQGAVCRPAHTTVM